MEGASMAASNQKKEVKQRNRRSAASMEQGSSRVSSAASGLGSQNESVQKARVEQRSSTPTTKQGTRAAAKPATRSKPGASGKGRTTPPRSAVPATPTKSANDPRDTQFIQW